MGQNNIAWFIPLCLMKYTEKLRLKRYQIEWCKYRSENLQDTLRTIITIIFWHCKQSSFLIERYTYK